MLSEIHFLLTYRCNFECDHCFLYCSPKSQGTFTINQVDQVLEEALKIGSIEWIYFEGGEPMLYYPLLVESVRRAHQKGFQVGIVSNGYGANSEEDAELWLKPLAEAGLSYLSISNDTFHYGDQVDNPASIASAATSKLGINSSPICIEPPEVQESGSADGIKGQTVIGGGAKFRGRAADTLTEGLPRRPWEELRECPDEDLVHPSRVHVDSFGNIHICQGISIGNFWEKPFSEIMASYHPDDHPICGPLNRGGPAELVKELTLNPEEGYVDECHLCFISRRDVIDRHPQHLTPRQVYGIE
ncbi:MAG: radical SAM protein [Anaerolineales bacterium]|nr:radical SAM protein [Anaerolineales bacterium]